MANAYVIYTMDICDFNPSIIKELDDKAAKLIRAKVGILPNSGNALLYAPLEQGRLGLIKLVDKMTNIKITGKFRQLKGNLIAELMLRYTLLNRKQNNSNRTTWLKLLENEGLCINKKYKNMWSIIKIMNQKINASEINEIKQSGLKYLTDIINNDRIINYNKLSTKTIKRINRQL